jgi:hypothetical protein
MTIVNTNKSPDVMAQKQEELPVVILPGSISIFETPIIPLGFLSQKPPRPSARQLKLPPWWDRKINFCPRALMYKVLSQNVHLTITYAP